MIFKKKWKSFGTCFLKIHEKKCQLIQKYIPKKNSFEKLKIRKKNFFDKKLFFQIETENEVFGIFFRLKVHLHRKSNLLRLVRKKKTKKFQDNVKMFTVLDKMHLFKIETF